jgi:hypothetical protein
MLRWRASVESRDLHLEQLGLVYLRHDEGAEAGAKTIEQIRREEQIWRSVRESIARESGKSGMALPMMLFMAALTFGFWTLWQLMKSGPNLLTGVILDGEVVPATPRLATRVSRENWFTNALGETYLFFLSLAFVAFVVGTMVPYFAMMREYRKAAHPRLQTKVVATWSGAMEKTASCFPHFVVSNPASRG